MTDGLTEMMRDIKTARVEVDLDADPGAFDDADEIKSPAADGGFDPAIHLTTKDGLPIKNKDGSFRKRAGRKSGAAPAPKTPHINLGRDELHIPEAPIPDHSLEMAAKTCAALYIQTGVIIFGNEWFPDPEISEADQLEFAFKAYFEAKGVIDIPPGVALAMALSGYAAKRLYMPKTQSKLSYAIGWLKGRFSRNKNNAARNDIGSNGMRENNAGAANGTKSTSRWRARFGS